MGEITKNVDNTTKTFVALLILGLVGLLFLIVFGNLSGNLGFIDTSTTTNETGLALNATIFTLSEASEAGFVSLSVTSVVNNSNGVTILTGNYTVDTTAGTIVGTAGRAENYTDIYVIYDSTFKAQGEQNTDGVINNLTGGANTFFTFSNVWFTLLAIVLLIIIVMAVIGVVQRDGGKSRFTS